MKQVYHSNATTKVRMRTEISNSNETNLELSKKLGVSLNTIRKWKWRDDFEDKSSRPATIHYSMSEIDMLIAVELRSITWWSLDEITEIINPWEPEKIRSAVYRTFIREGVNKVPEKEKEKSNDIIKNKTIKISKYDSVEQMNDDLMKFLVHYNLYRRHGSLRRELKVKTPFDAIVKWFELDKDIFTLKPMDFKNKILSSKYKQVVFKQQPCET